PVIGTRNREVRNHFALPPELGRPNLHGLTFTSETTHRPREGEIYSSLFDPKFTWRGVEWLCSVARVPVLLKGILNPDDAEIAATSGAAGVIVSNHGGKKIGKGTAAHEALAGVVDPGAGRKSR